MRVVRNPDERFIDLVDFPFSPNYLEIDDGAAIELAGVAIDFLKQLKDYQFLLQAEASLQLKGHI